MGTEQGSEIHRLRKRFGKTSYDLARDRPNTQKVSKAERIVLLTDMVTELRRENNALRVLITELLSRHLPGIAPNLDRLDFHKD